MGTTFAPGQLSQLGSIINIGVATALPRVAEKYGDPKAVLRALDGRGAVFATKMEAAIEQAINSMLVLAPRGNAGGTTTERHDPDAFFRTRESLYVWDGFRTNVVAKAKPVEAGTACKAESLELMRDLTDEEIEAALPTDHFFEESRLCALIAGLIARQAKGEEGVLLNNGYANLFYTSSCVLSVHWLADYRRWYVSSWQRDDSRWGAGLRVFSPAN